MDKERESKFESGFSEKQMDLNVDKSLSDDQTKAGNIPDPQKKKKVKITLDSQSQ